MLRRMQTLVLLQTQARASCVHLSTHTHSYKSSHSSYPRCSSNAKFRDTDLETQFGSNWLESEWNQTRDPPSKNMHQDDEKSDKILEVDTWKPQLSSHHGSSNSFPIAHHYIASDYDNGNIVAYDSPSKDSSEALNPSLSSRKEVASGIYENSPQAFSASSRLGSGVSRGPFTPTKSEFSCGFLSSYSSHPNYMANTESSRAKVRSQSAPRQRLEFERYGSSRSYIQGHCDHPGP